MMNTTNNRAPRFTVLPPMNRKKLKTKRNNVSQKDQALRQAQSKAAKARNKLSRKQSSFVDPCTLEYTESLIDPFRKDLAPCVPYGVAIRSQKVCVFSEGSFLTGVSGWGGVTVYGALVSDNIAAVFTGASYGSAVLPKFGDPNTTSINFANSPFTGADLSANDGVEVRLCSLGVRVRYVGTELNRGGLRYAIQHPEHLSVANMSASDIAQFDFRQIDSQTRDWTSVCYTPLKQADYDFTDNPSGFTGGAQKQGVDPRPILGILCESASTSIPLPFEFQIVAHYEAIGAKARGKTISNTDVTATLKAVSAVTQGPPGLSTAISNHKVSAPMVAAKAATEGSTMWEDLASKVGSTLGGYAAEQALAMLL
jgi:hypothetical protein